MSARMTRITAVDVDSGESETIEIKPGQYIVICGGDRYVSSDLVYATGTNVVTIKTYKGGGDHR